MKTRIMYIESKGEGLSGPGRIGRVAYSKSGQSVYYKGRRFVTLKGRGYKCNYRDVETSVDYWISGPKRDGNDRLYGGNVEIDEDVREEYWNKIRKQPANVNKHSYKC